MSTESQNESGFPALLELKGKLFFEEQMRVSPLHALKKHIRTYEEFESVIKDLVKKDCPDLSEPEDLILFLFGKIKGRRGPSEYFEWALEKIIGWYVKSKPRWDTRRSHSDDVRVFRFLLSTVVAPTCTGVICDERLEDEHLCGWRDDVINRFVRNKPFLYWSHYRYREGIIGDLRNVIQCCCNNDNNDTPYDNHHWPVVERAVRQIVKAQDWNDWETGMPSLIRQIKDLCDDSEKELPIDHPSRTYDEYRPDEVRAFLDTALRRLHEQKQEAQKLSEFEDILKEEGGLQGRVIVEVVNEVTHRALDYPKDEKIDPRSFVVRIFCSNDSEKSALASVLKDSSVFLNIEGGYCFDGLGDRQQGETFSKTGVVYFSYILFAGRSRLTLTLVHWQKGGKEKSVVVPFFIETEVVSKEGAE